MNLRDFELYTSLAGRMVLVALTREDLHQLRCAALAAGMTIRDSHDQTERWKGVPVIETMWHIHSYMVIDTPEGPVIQAIP